MEYFIVFYEGVTCQKGKFSEGQIIKAVESEMWQWLQLAHTDDLKISVYTAKCVIDFS